MEEGEEEEFEHEMEAGKTRFAAGHDKSEEDGGPIWAPPDMGVGL